MAGVTKGCQKPLLAPAGSSIIRVSYPQELMTKYKLEYIWLDGKQPVPDLRGKTLIKSFENPPTLADMPEMGF